jgi:hypothetical protein
VRRPDVLFYALVVAACAWLGYAFLVQSGPESWKKFPMSSPPGQQCRSGAEAGYDVFVWECHEGKRVAIYQYSTPLSRRQPVREETPCGGRTPIEERLKLMNECEPPPEGLRWGGM